jgi:tripeptidyl-peptidase I
LHAILTAPISTANTETRAIPQGTYPENRLIDGAGGASEVPSNPPSLDGSESQLDFEIAWPLIYPQRTVFFGVDDQYYQNKSYYESNDFDTFYAITKSFFNTFLDALDGSYCTYSAYGETGDCTKPECLDPVYPDPNNPGGYKGQLQCGVYKPTNVLSISWGVPERLLPGYYMRRQCNEWMKLALQGVTIVNAAGDTGVGIPGFCSGPNSNIFQPEFISSCPYILSVGGTQFIKPNGTCDQPYPKLIEEGSTDVYTSGGFSNIFPRPSYQDSAVTHYLNTVKLPFTSYDAFPDQNFDNITKGVFNRPGRAYPDVAAVAANYLIRWNESWWTLGGTSVGTPIWASAVTLINEARLAEGKSTVGFINPILVSALFLPSASFKRLAWRRRGKS